VTPRTPRRALHPSTPPWIARAVLFTLAAYWLSRGVVTAARALEGLLVVVVISFVVASAFEIPVAWLAQKMRRGIAAGLVIGLTSVVVVGLLLGVGVLVAHQISSLFTHLPSTLAQAVVLVNNHLHTHLSAAQVRTDFSKLNLSHSRLTHVALSSLAEVASLLAGLLFTFYFVAEGPKLRANLCSLLPPEHQPEMTRAFDIAVEKAGGYFLSRFILSALRFGFAIALLLPCHVPEPFALAVWYALLSEFIPVVGTTLATALPVAVALTVSPGTALVVLVTLLLITAVRNYFLAPKLTRHTVQLHPALAFASVIAAAILFGPLAGLLAVPVLATITAFSSSYIHRHELAELPSTSASTKSP
jgi:predicted PurR-regulated permease PerM